MSSMVASCKPMRRRISSGLPSTSILPWSWIMKRSQYSASSMKCVVMMMVVPRSESAVISRQNVRRASGSMPLVGSSRNRIFGS